MLLKRIVWPGRKAGLSSTFFLPALFNIFWMVCLIVFKFRIEIPHHLMKIFLKILACWFLFPFKCFIVKQRELYYAISAAVFCKNQKQPPEVFCKNKLQAWRPKTLLKSDSTTGAFLWNFRNFEEHLRTTASEEVVIF